MAPPAGPVVEPLYLDHPASTPADEEVIEAMLPWLRARHANPHADHRHGQHAAAAVEQARGEVAALIGADISEIVFTSGATESNNLALRGFWPRDPLRGVLAMSGIEHKSLLETARDLSTSGLDVHRLPTDAAGKIDMEATHGVLREIEPTTPVLVCCGHANNELGTVQDVAALADAAHARGGHLHVDAAQSLGKLPLDVGGMGIDLASLSSHKIYGPAGIGALFVGADVRRRMRPLLTGGGQEGGLRSGTVPVFLAVGFGRAAALAAQRRALDEKHLQTVVTAFVEQLHDAGVVHRLLSPPRGGLPGLVSLALPDIDAADLLDRLASRLSAATGSACNAGELRASHVLRAIGMSEAQAREVLRLGFGRDNTPDHARWAACQIAEGVERVRL